MLLLEIVTRLVFALSHTLLDLHSMQGGRRETLFELKEVALCFEPLSSSLEAWTVWCGLKWSPAFPVFMPRDEQCYDPWSTSTYVSSIIMENWIMGFFFCLSWDKHHQYSCEVCCGEELSRLCWSSLRRFFSVSTLLRFRPAHSVQMSVLCFL